MKRRDLLKVAPAALAVGAVPAAAAGDTPIMVLFREWLTHRDWLNSPATDDMTDDEFCQIGTQNWGMVIRMLELPAQDMRDLCCKLLAVTEMGTDLNIADVSATGCLPVEARALIGT